MDKFKDYLLGQADKLTAWIGFCGLCLYFTGFHSLLFILFIALIVLPESQFSDFFKERTQQLRDLDAKRKK